MTLYHVTTETPAGVTNQHGYHEPADAAQMVALLLKAYSWRSIRIDVTAIPGDRPGVDRCSCECHLDDMNGEHVPADRIPEAADDAPEHRADLPYYVSVADHLGEWRRRYFPTLVAAHRYADKWEAQGHSVMGPTPER